VAPHERTRGGWTVRDGKAGQLNQGKLDRCLREAPGARREEHSPHRIERFPTATGLLPDTHQAANQLTFWVGSRPNISRVLRGDVSRRRS
jgi:hypothetical protein